MLFTTLHLALSTVLTVAYGVMIQDPVLIEAGFKISIALVSINIAMRTVSGSSSIGIALSVSLVILLLYLTTTGSMPVAAIAYVILCVIVSAIYKPSLYHSSRSHLYYIEKATLYTAPTLLLLVFYRCHTTLVYVIAITALLVLAMELHTLLSPSASSLGLHLVNRLKKLCPKARRLSRFVGTPSHYFPAKLRDIARDFARGFHKFMYTLTKSEDRLSIYVERAQRVIVGLVQSLAKIERCIEDSFYRISESVEVLQHRIEHSLILLLFLMGLLLLVAIVLYVLLLTT